MWEAFVAWQREKYQMGLRESIKTIRCLFSQELTFLKNPLLPKIYYVNTPYWLCKQKLSLKYLNNLVRKFCQIDAFKNSKINLVNINCPFNFTGKWRKQKRRPTTKQNKYYFRKVQERRWKEFRWWKGVEILWKEQDRHLEKNVNNIKPLSDYLLLSKSEMARKSSGAKE